MKIKDVALLWFMASISLIITEKKLVAAILFAVCYIAAYTDYKTRNIYTIVNVAGLIAGVLINFVENQ